MSELRTITPGWLKFHRDAFNFLQGFDKYEEAIMLTNELTSVYGKALQQSRVKKKVGESPEKQEADGADLFEPRCNSSLERQLGRSPHEEYH